MNFQQAIGPHQPDKPSARVHFPERLDGVDGVISTQFTLQAGDGNPGIGGRLFGGGALPLSLPDETAGLGVFIHTVPSGFGDAHPRPRQGIAARHVNAQRKT